MSVSKAVYKRAPCFNDSVSANIITLYRDANKLSAKSDTDNIPKVYYTKSSGLRLRIDLLRGFTSVEKCDIIVISDTWMASDNKHLSTEFKIDGYDLFNADRKRKRMGGLALYVENTIICYINESLKTEDNVVSVWVETEN